MKHLVSRELHAYWDRLRGARAAPERSDLDPGAIRSILADTFLAEIKGSPSFAGREFTIRLSGTRLNALWGHDLKGRSLLSLWRPEDHGTLGEILNLVLDDQLAVVAGARSQDENRAPLELEILLLPLRHNGKTHVRLFGSIVPNQGSHWRGLRPVGALALTSFRSISPPLMPRFLGPVSSLPRKHGRFTVYEGGR